MLETKKINKKLGILFLVGILAISIVTFGLKKVDGSTNRKAYGVFLGIDSKSISKLYNYDTVVIDAAYFSKKDIVKLHKKGIKVYSYLNIGSVENFRSYYKKLYPYTLSPYENWPEERWLDLSKSYVQEYLTKTVASKLAKKGIDGFFIDNADVYYVYPKTSIYKGLIKSLSTLKKEYNLPIIINGGDSFVSKIMEEDKKYLYLIDKINQETVFSSINFDTGTFGTQTSEDTKYFKEYLAECKKNSIGVYLLEYTKDKKLITKIKKYCNQKDYDYYVSKTLELK